MTYLSEALKKYYCKEGNKLVFQNKYSLNQLALEMWERLDYSGMDPSVLSRVLSGERLFTEIQLEVFCQILGLPFQDVEALNQSLHNSMVSRYGRWFSFSKLSLDTIDFIDSLLKTGQDFLENGKYHEANEVVSPVEDFLEKMLKNNTKTLLQAKICDQLSTVVYFKGKSVIAKSPAGRVLNDITLSVSKLKKLFSYFRNEQTEIRINSLLAHGNYIAGGYTNNSEREHLYKDAVKYGHRAFIKLPYSNFDKLLVMRVVTISTIYLQDELNFMQIKDLMLKNLKLFPKDQFFYGSYLFNTISNGMLLFRMSKSNKVRELSKKYFSKTLRGGHMTELSDIRSGLETYLRLGIKEDRIENKINRGLQIASEENYPRHFESIKKMASKLL